MPSFHPSYIEKSNENWACVENLLKQASRFPNVIASRMYYSMFQLVKYEMVSNNEDPALPEYMKMSDDATTGVHVFTNRYINEYLVSKTQDKQLGRKWKKLLHLRIQADYYPAPVTPQEVQESYEVWREIRTVWLECLKENRRISS